MNGSASELTVGEMRERREKSHFQSVILSHFLSLSPGDSFDVCG